MHCAYESIGDLYSQGQEHFGTTLARLQGNVSEIKSILHGPQILSVKCNNIGILINKINVDLKTYKATNIAFTGKVGTVLASLNTLSSLMKLYSTKAVDIGRIDRALADLLSSINTNIER